MKTYYLALLIFLFSCSSSSNEESQQETAQEAPSTEVPAEKPINSELQSDYMVKFTKIDNVAYIEIDDSVIYKSEFTYGGENDIDYRVDLTKYVEDGAEKISIGLINGTEPYEDQADTHWEIMFDLILEGEVVDFIHEIKLENELGYVYEAEYNIDDWRPSLN